MADVRSLLRQQRAARRIEHPHAAYSDGGKLLCTLCHEPVKAEALWDGHVRGAAHRQRAQQLKVQLQAQQQSRGQATRREGEDEQVGQTTPPLPAPAVTTAQAHKRKHSEDEDEEMDGQTEEEAVRKKRSRPDMVGVLGDGLSVVTGSDSLSVGSATPDSQAHVGGRRDRDIGKATPPHLIRRTSGTPVQGVEMQIPSRPATPTTGGREGSASLAASSGSTGTTPRSAPLGRSPLIPQEAISGSAPGIGLGVTLGPTGAGPSLAAPNGGSALGRQSTTISTAAVNEDEWAAFEAEMIQGAQPTNGTKPNGTGISSDAVILAPALSAEQLAAQSEEEERAKRKAQAEIDLEDEKEEATRALETEFEEMEQLEARVSKLKERREALRQQGEGVKASPTPIPAAGEFSSIVKESAVASGEENASGDGVEEDDDDGDDDGDEDDWDAFRFRA